MKLISSTPDQKREAIKFAILIITVVLIIAIPVWFLFIRGKSEEGQIAKNIQLAATEILEEDKAVSEFKIDSIELSAKNEASEEVYLLQYSIKPIDPNSLILAGSGIKGEDGWIHELVNYVTVKANEQLVFNSPPSSP